ncbi:acyltransferase [Altererythrobacter endophyticus]|uniref:Acyltransferase n=2 Tax=Altericroceibacterium endophyticum TaxID=1808508 RepID=A0A6I4T3P7_9SPHN|nr:acyltransferase [Altericroceibacterium endophyticum]
MVITRLTFMISGMMIRLRFWPHFQLGGRVRFFPGVRFLQIGDAALLKVRFAGANTIGQGTMFQGSGTIHFGARSLCGPNCIFGANTVIDIGTDVLIAGAVNIRDSNHRFDDPARPIVAQGISSTPIRIGDGAWLAQNVSVLEGVTIGPHAVIGAGAVVTRDILAGAIAAGVPARIIKMRPGFEIPRSS